MEPAGAELLQPFDVLFRAVSLMAMKAVFRMQPVHETHPLVAHHLGHDRGAGNGKGTGIPADNGSSRRRTAGRHMEPIHEHELRNHGKFLKGANHGQMRSAVDADPVDLLRTGRTHADRGRAQNFPVSPFPGRRGQPFGIVDEAGAGDLEQQDGPSHHRTGERTPAGFIDAGQEARLNSLSALKLLVELQELTEPQIRFQTVPRCGRPCRPSCGGNTAWPVGYGPA